MSPPENSQLKIKLDGLTQPLCSRTITVPSSLLQVAPSQCLALVLLLLRLLPLKLLPLHQGDWFPQFRKQARIRLMPSLRRTPPTQNLGALWIYPGITNKLQFWCHLALTTLQQ
jgi:hypothetical protein